MSSDLIQLTPRGLYCEAGDFFIDPWPDPDQPARQSIVTHGHADHARPGSQQYYCTRETGEIMRRRIASDINVVSLAYGEVRDFGPVRVSLHSAGHVLGSAQVRVEHNGEVWVASGDYKRDADPSCEPFEVVQCDAFITEATFAMPLYRWRAGAEVAADIYAWWQENAANGRVSVLFSYALGKTQRVLAELGRLTEQPALLHGAMSSMIDVYRQANVAMLPTLSLADWPADKPLTEQLVIAPPSASGSAWMRRFQPHSTGFVSGWMRIRGNRRRQGYDRGFVLSDHADWPGLLKTIEETGARRVLATHGKTDILVKYLQSQGIAAEALVTKFGNADADGDDAPRDADSAAGADTVAAAGHSHQ